MNHARKVAICVDIWSKKGLSASCLGVTAHFFTPHDHKRNQATLAVRKIASPHTVDHIEATVEEFLGEWSIPKDKISAVLTDNGSNMVKAFREWLGGLNETSDNSEEEEMQEEPVEENGGNSPLSVGSEEENVVEHDSDVNDATEREINDLTKMKWSMTLLSCVIKAKLLFSHPPASSEKI